MGRDGSHLADGADVVHPWRIAERAIQACLRDGNVKAATGRLPLQGMHSL
ncbi:MAG: hypothetical protein GY937_27750 [bacterium]|nr:hypothetical protein [bacterium]